MPTNFPPDSSENDIRELDRRAVRRTLELLIDVTEDQLDRPTPCADWDLRDLLEHMSVQHRGFAAAARGQGADLENWHLPAVLSDPIADYRDAAETAIAAYAAIDLDEIVEIGEFGPEAKFPAAKALEFHLLDYLVHGWDVAQAVGRPFTPDADVVRACWQIAEMIPTDDASRPAGGPFGPVVPIPQAASSFARLLAHVGRTPMQTS